MSTTHLITERRDKGYRLIYHIIDEEEGESLNFSYDVRRVVLGICLPDSSNTGKEYGYVCAIAERVFYPRSQQSKTRPEAMFVVIDEYEGPETGMIIGEAIKMKDKYLCEQAFCRTQDVPVLKEAEGLSFYRRDRNPIEYQYVFTTFVDVMTVANLTALEPPGNNRNGHIAELSALLSTFSRDPDTGQPVLDGDGKAVPRLMVFEELNTEKAATGLQRPSEEVEISMAVWLAASGMDKFRPRYKPDYPTEERTRNHITGY